MHVEPEQVADAVRKEERVRAALEEAVDVAAENAELDQPLEMCRAAVSWMAR